MAEDMDVENLSFEEMLKGAVKAEINAREVYEHMAGRVDNFVLSERFEFLAGEEEKHEGFLRNIYESIESKGDLETPEETPVPLPYIRYGDDIDESEIIEQAMDAEMASRDFYQKMAEEAEDAGLQRNPKKLLNYLAGMEQNHYEILKEEFNMMSEFEEFDQYYPAMHQGP
ncbi:MAG: ferritin family protein [Candidatus Thermoplasmatota archaeon]|nr:ferritin family protein [Candidatus Thermoplasmatota archaeon]